MRTYVNAVLKAAARDVQTGLAIARRRLRAELSFGAHQVIGAALKKTKLFDIHLTMTPDVDGVVSVQLKMSVKPRPATYEDIGLWMMTYAQAEPVPRSLLKKLQTKWYHWTSSDGTTALKSEPN